MSHIPLYARGITFLYQMHHVLEKSRCASQPSDWGCVCARVLGGSQQKIGREKGAVDKWEVGQTFINLYQFIICELQLSRIHHAFGTVRPCTTQDAQ